VVLYLCKKTVQMNELLLLHGHLLLLTGGL
jgi:hypothetical protein